MGPGFGRDWGRAIAFAMVVCAVVGVALGACCYAGCSWLIRHVDMSVDWKP